LEQGCEPTYEELKQSVDKEALKVLFELRAYLRGIETLESKEVNNGISKWLRAYLRGIETLHQLSVAMMIGIGCEPTYEELKH